MNRTDIEWVRNPDGSKGFTCNPIFGCLRGCDYCYARRWAERGLGECGLYEKGQRFQPRFFPERLEQIYRRKKPAGIFVGSMAEVFGPWVPDEWIVEVLHTAHICSWHRFYFLTKYPENLGRWTPWPPNAWVGATATNRQEAFEAARRLSGVEAPVKYLSCEPLLESIEADDLAPYDLRHLNWIIVGVQTGSGAKPVPTLRLHRFIDSFSKVDGLALFVKDNVGWSEKRQEWPR